MMKHYYFRLMLLLALTWLVPKANAQTYFSYSGDTWDAFYLYETTGYGTHSAMWFQGAATNGRIYTLPATMSTTTFDTGENGETLSYFIDWTDGSGNAHKITRGLFFDFEQNGAEYFSVGNYSGYPVGTSGYYWYAGPAIAADDAGTLWLQTLRSGTAPSTGYDGAPWNGGVKAVAYYKQENLPTTSEAGTRVGIDLSSYNIGRSDLMSAYGDGANGTGYLWFSDLTNNKVVRVKIVNGQAAGEIEFTPPVTISDARCLTVQYTDNRVIFSSGRYGDKKIYRGVIDEANKKITWYDLGVTTVGNHTSTGGSPGATMFILGGYEYLAYSSSTTQVSINVYDGTNPANATALETFSLTPFTDASASSWMCHSINAVVADDKMSADLYIYIPQRGAFKRKLTAVKTMLKDPVQNLAVELKTGRDSEQPERLDAVLTWDAPANGTVSSYTVYSRMTPWYSYELNASQDAVIGRQDTWSEWEAVGTTSETTFAHLDLTMWHSSSQETERLYEYKVVPTFTAGGIGAESDIVQVSAYLVPFIPRWDLEKDQDDIKAGIDRYDGYCKVQLYWKFPQVNNYQKGATSYKNVYGMKPDYYSVLRDGKTIATNINAYNYIDLNVKSEKSYTYQVVSHYNSFPNDTAVSTPNTVYVEKRDWAKVGYELTEIYNYSIATAEGTTPADSLVPLGSDYTNFRSSTWYKQGAFYDGYWYIAQGQDASGASGGIIKVSAAAPWENSTENILTPGTKILSNTAQSNVGVACDEGGNLFVQSGTLLLNGTTTSTYWYNRMAKGTIYMNNGNGTYTTYTVDFAGNSINFADGANAYEKGYQSTVPGRSEYYSLKGNLKTDGFAYLYVAPFQSKTVFVIKLTYNGSTVVPSIHAKYVDNGTSSFTGEEFRYNNENYAFPVLCEGRENEFIYQLRSSAYSAFACHSDADRAAGRITTVYDTQSRVNTAGGCTLEFNGELFIITPQSQYSANTGNFYIGMAERGDGDTPATANLSHIIPVAMWTQKDAESGIYSSANIMNFYAEVGDEDVNGDGILNDYAYIYMYSPYGKRFAKYMLTPSSTFPPSQVKLTVAAQYAEDYDASNHNPGDDIERFDATASWTEVLDYGVTSGGNVYYRIKGYTLQLVDASGDLVDDTDANGNLLYPMIEFDVDENGVPTTIYTITIKDGVKTRTAVSTDSEIYKNLTWTEVTRVDADGNEIKDIMYSYVYKDVEKDINYTAQVTVNYIGVDESNAGVEQKSAQTEYEDVATYTPVAPSGNVLVKVDEDRWSDWDADYQGNPANGGAKDADDAYFDNYRICFDIENPDFGSNRVEPVTNYTISYNDGTNTVPVDEFFLYVGLAEGEKYTITGADGTVTEYTVDHDGYIKITNGQIPGDYNFDSINTGGKPHVYWDMQDYTSAPGYDDGVNFTSSNNPSTWSYIVTANYAANNARISEVAPATMGTDGSGITTGVEIISTQSRLNIYPIPATITITIKCSEAIEAVEIYSASGLLVKTVEGNADQVMTVDVSDLASGYYFMRVNNLAPVKIVKR